MTTNLQPQTYFVKFPTSGEHMGKLPLVVDLDGSRWLALNLFADLIDLSMRRDIIPMLEHSPRNWKAQVVGGKHCLPAEKANEFIQKLRVYPAQAAAHDWLGRHATQTLRGFTIPEPVAPMLADEPEPVICPAIPRPAPSGQLITIQAARIAGAEVNAVNGRDLHAFLEVGTAFKDWISRSIEDFGFTDGSDFCSFLSESTGGRPAKEYMIGLSMAKELAMVQRTAKGKEARLYFIECERKAMNPVMQFKVPQTLREALLLAADQQATIEAHEATISVLEPKAAGLERIATRKDDGARTLTDAAKILQQAPRKFINYLQVEGWIYRQNQRWMAYQPKISAGMMEHKYCTVQHDSGPEFGVPQPLITSKGIAKLAVMLGGAA